MHSAKIPLIFSLSSSSAGLTLSCSVSQTDKGTEFRRSHHMVRKTTLYDMDVDATCKYAAVGCQDRCIR